MVDGTVAMGGILAMLVASLVMLLLSLVVYIYSAIALMGIAKKTGTPNRWLAFIPIANVYLVTQMAGVSALWTLIIFAAIIPLIGGFAVIAAMIWMFWHITAKIGFPEWTSLLLLIPLVNLVMLGIWAWGSKEKLGLK